jgi:DNA-binding beta-propeller fold protein YncE
VDRTGNIYVSSTRDSQIVIYRRDGHLLGSFGRPGMEIGEFSAPAGLWIDGTNRLYVGDTNNGRVQVFQLSQNVGVAVTTDFSPRELESSPVIFISERRANAQRPTATAMCGFLAFIPGHLTMVVLHGWANFYFMLSGWKR